MQIAYTEVLNKRMRKIDNIRTSYVIVFCTFIGAFNIILIHANVYVIHYNLFIQLIL